MVRLSPREVLPMSLAHVPRLNVLTVPASFGYPNVRISRENQSKNGSNSFVRLNCVTTALPLVKWQELARREISVRLKAASLNTHVPAPQS